MTTNQIILLMGAVIATPSFALAFILKFHTELSLHAGFSGVLFALLMIPSSSGGSSGGPIGVALILPVLMGAVLGALGKGAYLACRAVRARRRV